ncbi:MAG: GyrI-like domain-containing protein [Anaerolineales bacterium]|uniref:GyrI-like domain-containing protein n=1 Tax=Candidatus Desulfolinea nitratireducens TaxID=2841698 RepID=A0A8J6THK4_9CHLR|nr:GyrI-like domain-containing protein [Candidatus Desulfolinea nitratireducens]MBL6960463.1 GyrI-like domain-containing protein [Anaerolineales bacterium]
MTKIDFKKTLKHLYAPKKNFETVDVPEMQFLMVDGHGDPNTAQEYQDAVEALYAVAYKMKFISKKTLEKDYVVPPLEGLWWAEDMDTFITREKSAWDWTMMIMIPDWITFEIFTDAIEQVRKKKDLPSLDKVRLENYQEGLSVQIMHIGSYDDEGPVLAKMHTEFIPSNGYVENGKHHEIYLSDPRRVAPEKLKTVLRQPIR